MAYEKKGASKILKKEKEKKEKEQINKNHNDQFNRRSGEEIKHNGNHGKDTFGMGE